MRKLERSKLELKGTRLATCAVFYSKSEIQGDYLLLQFEVSKVGNEYR
jgi:hypothetical protein